MGMPRGQQPLTDVEVRQILDLKGEDSAQNVGLMFDRSAESVRRIWRGETKHRVARAMPVTPELVAESQARLMALLEGDGEAAAPAVPVGKHTRVQGAVDPALLAQARMFGATEESIEHVTEPGPEARNVDRPIARNRRADDKPQ